MSKVRKFLTLDIGLWTLDFGLMNVIFELHGFVALVRLNRPDRMNALSSMMLDEIGSVFERIEGARAEGAVRAVVLTGEGGRAFCAGTDINELAALDAEEARPCAGSACAIRSNAAACR